MSRRGYRYVVPMGQLMVGLLAVLFVAVVFLLLASPGGNSALADDANACTSASGVQDVVSACTALIDSKRLTNKQLAVAYTRRGYAFGLQGDYDRAIVESTKAIESDSQYGNAFNVRGEAYYAKGEFDHAIANFNEAIRVNRFEFFGKVFGEDASTYANRGEAYRAQGRLNEAILDFDQAIRLDSTNIAAYTHRGLTYETLGQRDKARDDFNAAFVAPPKNDGDKSLQDTALRRLEALKAEALRANIEAEVKSAAGGPWWNRMVSASSRTAEWVVSTGWGLFILAVIALGVVVTLVIVFVKVAPDPEPSWHPHPHGDARTATEIEAHRAAAGAGQSPVDGRRVAD